MKLIGRLLLYVLIACLVVIFGFYFLLQTRWGADHVSNWVSENSGYHLTFDVMIIVFPPHPIFYWRM